MPHKWPVPRTGRHSSPSATSYNGRIVGELTHHGYFVFSTGDIAKAQGKSSKIFAFSARSSKFSSAHPRNLRKTIDEIANKIFLEKQIQAVVQLRIEPDWQHHAATYLRSLHPDDRPTTYQGILQRVARSLGASARTILLTCDETQVPAEEIAPGDWAHYLYCSSPNLLRVEKELFRDLPLFAHDPFYSGLLNLDPYIAVGQDRGFAPVTLRAHIGHQRDRVSRIGSIKPSKPGHNFQGFTINTPEANQCEIHYRARLANGDWTPWMEPADRRKC